MIEDPRDAYSAEEFASRHGISRSLLYYMWKHGEGPRYFHIGAHRMISREAGEDWRRSLEQKPVAQPRYPRPGRPRKNAVVTTTIAA
jgi:hypothetical protein